MGFITDYTTVDEYLREHAIEQAVMKAITDAVRERSGNPLAACACPLRKALRIV